MKTRRLLVITFLAVAGCDAPKNDTLQGYAEGEYVRVGAPYAGTLVRLDVQRGSSVPAGAPLFALEAENESAARREAEDRLGNAQAQLENLRKGRRPTEIDAARAQLAQSQAAAAFSAAEVGRQEDLLARGFATRQQVEEARTAAARDRARVEELQAQLATAHLAARPDEIRAAQAQASAAKAALDQADWRLKQRTAISTVSGVVTDTLFVRGEWVGAGQPVVTLLPPENLKVRFFVSEPRLGSVKLGQPVELRCDGCGDPIRAAVTWIAPQPEYTPPVIYSRESRGKLVFLVEARPAPADSARLKPGQPLDVVLR
jgi:HlyD family secretion protein